MGNQNRQWGTRMRGGEPEKTREENGTCLSDGISHRRRACLGVYIGLLMATWLSLIKGAELGLEYWVRRKLSFWRYKRVQKQTSTSVGRMGGRHLADLRPGHNGGMSRIWPGLLRRFWYGEAFESHPRYQIL